MLSGVILRCLSESFFVTKRSVPSDDGDADDYDIADDAEWNGHFMKEQKSPECSKDDLNIVEDREFFCRSISVGGCDAELAGRCGEPRHDEYQPLLRCHRSIVEYHERQCE